MSETQELDSESFNSNYQILKKTADRLSGQKEPDIDQLVPKVETAMKAYAICKDRLDKVQTTLGRYFEKDGAKDATPSSDGDEQVRRTPRAIKEVEEEDQDIPF
jgi:exodeoxyribonuclease VII small subunit